MCYKKEDFFLYNRLLIWAKEQLDSLSNPERLIKAKEMVGSDNIKTLLEKIYG